MSRPRRVLLYGLCAAILLAGAGLAALYFLRLRPAPGDRLPGRRGPYLQSVTPHSVWVVWDTARPTVGRLEYGPTRELGQAVAEQEPARHHEVQLAGLEPYAEYQYRVDGGRIASFRTAAPPQQARFRFVAYGDTREGPLVHRALVKRMAAAAPDFVLHTGDMVEFGDCVICWDEFFSAAAPLLRAAPLYPTLGNHEDDQSPFAGTSYFDVMHLPGAERWYAFSYGNARLISLKADGYPVGVYYPEAEQLDWLEGELAANDRPWTFVLMHWGVFTSRGEDELELGMRGRLVPLFERYGVDIVFMGHNHGYERVEVNGVTYLTTAGGGAPLYDLAVPEPGSQAEARAFHFVLLDVDGERLAGQAVDRQGKVIDRFERTAGR